MEFKHLPVLKNEVLDFFSADDIGHQSASGGGIFVDGTLGGGGHTLALLSFLQTTNYRLQTKIIGIDRDLEAIFAAKKNLTDFSKQVTFVHDNFSNLPAILKSINVKKADGIFLDLGVSSYQLENPARGFSFQNDVPLDMRMNQEDDLTASDIVNYYDEKKLADIFWNLADERYSRRIAKNIVHSRKLAPIKTTGDLVEIIRNSTPTANQHKQKIHFATRVFQALRIETNSELKVLEDFIPTASELLNSGGRLAIISFHSKEDRIVKWAFRKLIADFPDKFKILTKKPIVPSLSEISTNPRARSAKLRVLERI
ncbi:MAG: 16S rRNA (cytosine(1402)-N(4))-methyltransferase RsmH [Candidatus Berkelbacteria bacterium]|nr:16S rRNA (cytosine(1402)-N(4))-methyltransferase RsmH [Candidatus Berkelbacteria bacterium]